MQNKTEILIPEATYHVYNRANGNELLFLSAENYRYFLQKYQAYISPLADTFCYCLMPNHFHFLLRIRTQKELEAFFKAEGDLQGFKNLEGLSLSNQKKLEDLLSKQFSNFFNSYAKAFNKQHNRKGSLFMHTFKRKRVTDNNYLLKLVQYIHHNPVEAGLCQSPQNWPYSSYPDLLGNSTGFIKKQEVIEWFNDLNNFIYYHDTSSELNDLQPI